GQPGSAEFAHGGLHHGEGLAVELLAKLLPFVAQSLSFIGRRVGNVMFRGFRRRTIFVAKILVQVGREKFAESRIVVGDDRRLHRRHFRFGSDDTLHSRSSGYVVSTKNPPSRSAFRTTTAPEHGSDEFSP